MTEKIRPIRELSVEENELPSFSELENNATETIDLDFLFQVGRNESVGSESKKLKKTAVGKILQALPIPALLIDQAGTVVFANRSCKKISVQYETILQAPFSSLFSDADSVRKAQSLIETVFATRKPRLPWFFDSLSVIAAAGLPYQGMSVADKSTVLVEPSPVKRVCPQIDSPWVQSFSTAVRSGHSFSGYRRTVNGLPARASGL